MKKNKLHTLVSILALMIVPVSVIRAETAQEAIDKGLNAYETSLSATECRDHFKRAMELEPSNDTAKFLYALARVAAVSEKKELEDILKKMGAEKDVIGGNIQNTRYKQEGIEHYYGQKKGGWRFINQGKEKELSLTTADGSSQRDFINVELDDFNGRGYNLSASPFNLEKGYYYKINITKPASDYYWYNYWDKAYYDAATGTRIDNYYYSYGREMKFYTYIYFDGKNYYGDGESNGIFLLSDFSSDLSPTTLMNFEKTHIMTELQSADANLAAISQSFSWSYKKATDTGDGTRFDYGDVTLLRCILHLYLAQTQGFGDYNWALPFVDLRNRMAEVGQTAFGNSTKTLSWLFSTYPNFGKIESGASLEAAKQSLIKGIELYETGSKFVTDKRVKTTTVDHLFEFSDSYATKDAGALLRGLSVLKQSINGQKRMNDADVQAQLTADEKAEMDSWFANTADGIKAKDIFYNEPVHIGALWSGINIASQIPLSNDFTFDAVRDPTFGGIFPEMTISDWKLLLEVDTVFTMDDANGDDGKGKSYTNGWRKIKRLGEVYTAKYPYLYTKKHGWWYAYGNSDKDLWLYDFIWRKWIWFSQDVQPADNLTGVFLYADGSGWTWFYDQKDGKTASPANRSFYQYNTSTTFEVK